MSSVIGLDIGKKRTGIAKADAMGIVIKPLKTVLTLELIEELKKLDQELGIEKFILGEPVNVQSGNTEAYDFVMAKKAELEELFKEREIVLIDERFTSKEAEAALKAQGQKLNKDNKELIDMYAAAIILEQYFNLAESSST